jgi:hypothetical protein
MSVLRNFHNFMTAHSFFPSPARAWFLAYLAVFAIQVSEAAPALTVMARSGTSGLNTIDPNIAINREGIIAFTGTDATGSRVFVVSSPGNPQGIVNAVSGRTCAGVGITSGADPSVVYRVFYSGPTSLLRKTSLSGTTEQLGSSVTSPTGPADWDSIAFNSIDVSSSGTAVVSGLIGGSTATALFIGNQRPLTQSSVYSGVVGLRPQISDIGEAVFRDNTGRIITNNASGPVRVVAGASNGFASDTGNRPGISADGTAIAFSGNRNSSGSGIYASLTPSGHPSVLVPVAGGSLIESNGDVFTGFTSEQRVGICAKHFPFSEDFFTVVFQGAKNGIAGVFARHIVTRNGVIQTLSSVVELAKVGDTIGGATATAFNLFRPINDDGVIAFTANLSDGGAAILKMSLPAGDLTLLSAQWDKLDGGLSFNYQAPGSLTLPAKAKLYWANGTTVSNKLPDVGALPFYETDVETLDTPFEARVLVPAENFSASAPVGTTHVLVILDEDKQLDETDENNNTFALPDVVLAGNAINATSTELIKGLLRSAGQPRATVTSTYRNPYNQARVMFDNAYKKISAAYKEDGQQVLQVYNDLTAGKTKMQIWDERVTIRKAMEDKILTFAPDFSKVSKHCSNPAKLLVLDIAPSEFGLFAGHRFASLAANWAQQDPTKRRFLNPFFGPYDPAFHLEVPQPWGPTANFLASEPSSRSSSVLTLASVGASGASAAQILFVDGAATATGTVSTGQSEYEFQGQAGDEVHIGLIALQYRRGALWDDEDTVLYLLDSENRIIASNDDDLDGGYQSSISQQVLPVSGTYKVVVVTFGKEPIVDSSNHVTGWQGVGGSDVDFSLSFFVVPAGRIAVEHPAGSDIANGGAKSFGSVVVNTSVDFTFTLKNTGSAELSLGTASIGGTDAAAFSAGALSNSLVATGSSTDLIVRFAPTTSGSKTATLHIPSSDPAKRSFDITLTGFGSITSTIYTVTPSAGVNGTINPSTPQTVGSGGSIYFTVTPANGYIVDQWLVNSVAAQTGGTGFTAGNITANTTIQVTFKLQPVTISTVAFGSATYVIGEQGGSVPISINRAGSSAGAFTVNFSTGGGTAVAGTDYVGQTNTPVIFAFGEMSKTVNVSVLNVPGYQGNRAFGASISVSSGEAQIGVLSASSVTILESAPNTGAFSDADWISMGGLPGANDQGVVHATAMDGSGNLYVGGAFKVIGNVVANGIAKWNGSTWSALGSGMNGSDGDNAHIYALAVSGGDLYAAGSFTAAGGISANNIAKWNGSQWSALGNGTDETVRALAIIGNDLYAGGFFTEAGGVKASGIAKWNGSTWSSLGSGISGSNPTVVDALAVHGNALYAAGGFTTAGGISVNNIAKWNGISWSALENGMDKRVRALAVSGDDLYAAGDFTTAGATFANRIAKWNGSAWSGLGSGLGSSVSGSYSPVYALAASGSDIYAGGDFNTAGGITANKIAKWNGSAWSALGSGMSSSGGTSSGGQKHVEALVVNGNDLYAGGWFTKAGEVTASYIAKWNGSAWSALGSGIDGAIHTFAVSGSDLYAGGWLTTAGGTMVSRIAKWNGSAWSALGSGMNGIVYALAASGGELYVAGSFTTAGGTTANRIAKWNGSAWSTLGSGMNGEVKALAVSGSDVYAGGEFTTAGGNTVNRIAKWNGSAWSALGTGMNSFVQALAVGGGDLYAGGNFTTAGGNTVNRIAKWNGSAWSPLATGMNDQVYSLAVNGGDLYAGGFFTTAGGVFANQIAKWNGSVWSALGGGMGGGDPFPFVGALAVRGNDLYAGGRFTTAGGFVTNNIAKWNGSAWGALGSGMNEQVMALALSGNDLYAGGYFTVAGTAVSGRIARADLDGAHEIDIQQPMGTSIASGSSKDLGTVNMGSTADISFIVANISAGVLNLTGSPAKVAVSGPDAGDFNVLAQPASFVSAGGTTTFIVRFAPTSGGIKRATVIITNNDFDESNYMIHVIGTGVDPTLPVTTITSSPATRTNSTSATITFTGSDDTTAVGSLVYEGRLDGGVFALVTSPVALSGLAEGVHTYEVRARDQSGNVDPTPATATWVLDLTAPQTTITTAPSGIVSSSEAIFEFSSSEALGTFTYVLDGGTPVSGTGPVTFTGLSPGSHSFSVAATDVAGNVDPTPASMTWVVRDQPRSQLALLGDSLTFNFTVAGSGPITLQWRKDTANIPNAKTSSLTFASLKSSDAAAYSLRVTSAASTEVSNTAYLGVITRGPMGVNVNVGATLTLNAIVTVPAGTTAGFRWQKDGVPLIDGGRISGAGLKTLKVSASTPGDAGNYTCAVTMTIPGGSVAATTRDTAVTIMQKPVLNEVMVAAQFAAVRVGQVVGFNIPAANAPTKFTITGLPAGVKLNTATGGISGSPASSKVINGVVAPYTLNVTASNSVGTSDPVTVLWTVQPLYAGAIGTFNGLVALDPMNQDLGGSLKLTVTSTAAYSGTLQFGTASYALRGSLGFTAINANPAAHFVISRPVPLSTLIIDLLIDPGTGALTGSASAGTFGPVVIDAWRNPWSAANKATAYVATYNTAFDPAGGDGPEGFGYAPIKVTNLGTVSWTGKLADGTAITGSTGLGPAGQIALYHLLYTKTGSIAGWLLISQATGKLDGIVNWFKAEQPENSTTLSYKLGFSNPGVIAIGATWVKPAGTILNLSAPSPPNAQVSLASIERSFPADAQHLFSISATNVVTPASPNPYLIKLSVTAATGVFSGSIQLVNDDPTDLVVPIAQIKRPVTYNGVLVSRTDFKQGVGFFNIAELPYMDIHPISGKEIRVTRTPLWSGSVTLGASP